MMDMQRTLNNWNYTMEEIDTMNLLDYELQANMDDFEEEISLDLLEEF